MPYLLSGDYSAGKMGFSIICLRWLPECALQNYSPTNLDLVGIEVLDRLKEIT